MSSGERSRAYPAITLDEAIEAASKFREELGTGPHDRGTIAKALGHSSLTGSAARKIGAMNHYGLLNRSKSQYELSDLADRIALYRDDDERDAAIREALGEPALFKSIIDRFQPEGQIPRQLSNILARDFGILPAVKDDVTKTFLRSAEFAGVIDSEGRFLNPATSPRQRDVPAEKEEETSENRTENRNEKQAVRPSKPVEQGNISAEGEPTDEIQRFVIALSPGRKAVLTVPAELTPRDVELIRMQVRLLEFQAGISDGGESKAKLD